MKANMKRTWPPLSSLLLLLAAALQAQQIQFAYTNNGDGAVTVTEAYYTTYFTHPGPAFTIPSSYNGMPVTCIGDNFSDPWGLYFTNITIPSSITNIGDYAFEDDEYLTSIYFEGNAPTVGLYAFETHSGGNTTGYYLASASGWTNGDFPIPLELWNPHTGSLEVTLSPEGAVAAGVQWEVDGGTNNDSGVTVSRLVTGSHVVSFVSVPGWTAPPNQTVTIKNDSTTKIKANFTAWPPNTAPLTVQVVGGGAVSPNDNGKLLKIGHSYTLTAESNPDVFFTGWTASGSENFVSNNTVLHFTMRSNLVLQASFIPNPFAAVAGQYIGLFMPEDGNTVQNSGYATLTITTKGTFSGYLQTGTTRHSLSGQLDANFDYTNTIIIPGDGPVTIGLNAAPGYSSINGTIDNSNWTATLFCNQLVGKGEFSGFGRYAISFTDSNGNPDGTGVMNFAENGATTLRGTLDGGITINASSTFSPLADNAEWPFYSSLDGGKGCFLGWMDLDGEGFDEIDGVSGNFILIEPAGSGSYSVSEIAASGQLAP
jgi:hypothetical protein